MRLLKAFSKYAIGTFLVLIVGFATTPILTRLVTTSEMGRYSMFMTLGNLVFTLLCVGMDQSYLRFYNEHEKDTRNYLLRTCMKLPFVCFLICSIIIILGYKNISVYIAGEEAFGIAILFIIYIFTLMLDRFWTLKIQMAQKEIEYSMLNVIRKLFYLISALAFIKWGFFDNGMNLMIAITLAEVMVLFFAYVIEYKNWDIRKKKINVDFKTLFKYGFPFAFASTITLFFHSTDKIMLKALSDYHNIGVYSGAQNIVNLLSQAQAIFVAFWTPTSYEHYSKHPDDTKFYVFINKIVSYGMLVILIGLICCKDIVVVLLGQEYRDAAFVFPFLAFMPVMTTISETTVMGINFKQKTKYHIWISVVSMITNAIGNYVLIIKFGATGAAVSTGLSYSVFFVLRTYFAQKVFPIDFALKRYAISVTLVYILAIYASFNNVNFVLIVYAAISMIIISFLYKDILLEMYRWILYIWQRRRKNDKTK